MVTCISCSQAIEDRASKCHHCGDSQSHWRNNVSVLVPVIASLMFVASVGSLILALSTDAWKKAFWKDEVKVISYSSGRSVILNTGSGPLFIEQAIHELDHGASQPYKAIRNIYVSVAPNSFVVFGKDVDAGTFVLKNNGQSVGKAKPYFFSKGHSQLKALEAEDVLILEGKCYLGYRSAKNVARIDQEFPCVATAIVRPIKKTD